MHDTTHISDQDVVDHLTKLPVTSSHPTTTEPPKHPECTCDTIPTHTVSPPNADEQPQHPHHHTPHCLARHVADVARAMKTVNAWKPTHLARQLSWDQQDQKRQRQMDRLGHIPVGSTVGFTEHSSPSTAEKPVTEAGGGTSSTTV